MNDVSNPNAPRIGFIVTDFSDVSDDKTQAFLNEVKGKTYWFKTKFETTNQGMPSTYPRFMNLISD
jgi:hypothetical protein